MKKISIITEKNESTDSYIIKNIVIFDDNKAPHIIKYNGIQDLIEVVNFVEKNGINILETGIKPAINNGLVEIIVNKDLRRIAELKAKIVKEQLNSMKINTKENKNLEDEKFTELNLSVEDREYLEYLKLYNLRLKGELSDSQLERINELKERNAKVLSLEYARNRVLEAIDNYKKLSKKEDLENAREEIEIRKKEFTELRNKYRNELKELIDKIEKEKIDDKKETNQEETYNKKQLSKEDKEYLEYLKLNILRAKKKLSKEDTELLERLKTNNAMVATIENARNEVIEAAKKVQLLKNTNSKEKEEAEELLKEKQMAYDELFENYKKRFTDNIEEINNLEKEFLPIDDKKDEKEETSKQTEQKNNTGTDIKEPDPFETRKKVIIKTNPSLNDKKDEHKETSNEEQKLESNRQETILPPVIKQEEQKPQTENNPEEKNKNNSGKIKENQEDNKKTLPNEKKQDEDKKGFTLVENDKKEKEAKGVNPKPNESKEVEVKNEKGEKTTVQVNKTSKLKKFFMETLAELLGIVDGIIEMVTGKDITVVTEPSKNKKETETSKKEQTEKKDNTQSQKDSLKKEPDEKDKNESDRNLITRSIISNYFEQYNVSIAARVFILQPQVVDLLNKYKNEEQIKEVVSSLAYGYEANYLATKDNNFRLNEDNNEYLTSFTHDFLCAKAIVNDYNAKQLIDLFGKSNITFEEIKNGFRNYCYTVATYKTNSREPLPLYYLTNGSPIPTDFLDIFNNRPEKINSAVDNYLARKTKIIANLNQMRESIKATENLARLELANRLFINGKDDLGKKVSSGIVDEEVINEIKNNLPELISLLNKYFLTINNSQVEYVGFNDTYKSIDRFLGISNRKENDYNQLIKTRNELNKTLSRESQDKASLSKEQGADVESEVKEMIEDTISGQTIRNDAEQLEVKNGENKETEKTEDIIPSSELKQELLEMKRAALQDRESSKEKNQELIKKK